MPRQTVPARRGRFGRTRSGGMLDRAGSSFELTIDRETHRMQDLTLIGVHEDGMHLLLADREGNRFRVELDAALLAAARNDRPRLGQIQIEIEGSLRPKDVQAMIRAGMSSEQVAERAGWTVEKVHRYEGPILAEREHVAGLARQVRLRARGAGQLPVPTLGERVEERLRSRELDPATARWDSRRTDRAHWTVVLHFTAGGRDREAVWDFDPLARTVVARDDEARWLSEDEDTQSTGPIPAPHLSVSTAGSHAPSRGAVTPPGRPSAVYDVEAEGGIATPDPSARAADTLDLMEAMRERSQQRGRRRRSRATDVPALADAPDDALPLERLAPADEHTDTTPPPAHPHPVDDPDAVQIADPRDVETAEPAAGRTSNGSGRKTPGQTTGQTRRKRSSAKQTRARRAETTPLPLSAASTGDNATPASTQTSRPTGDVGDDPPTDETTPSRGESQHPAARSTTRKSGRPSVPSWDDIMFGRKSE